MVKYNKYKCEGCQAEGEGVNDVDASRGIVHKDGCRGQLDLIVLTEKAQPTETPKKTESKKK